jgi:positive regulator of sigma E activity
MDDHVEVIVRQVYTVQDALAAVGGFMGIAFVIGFLFLHHFQKFIYKSSILQSLFVY